MQIMLDGKENCDRENTSWLLLTSSLYFGVRYPATQWESEIAHLAKAAGVLPVLQVIWEEQ